MPGGNTGALIISVVCSLWALIATIGLLWPGFFDTLRGADGDASLPEGFAGKRGVYELTQPVPLAAMIVLGLVFYAMGAATRRDRVEIDLTD